MIFTIVAITAIFSLISDIYIFFKYIPKGFYRKIYALKTILMQLSLAGLMLLSPRVMIWLIVVYLMIYLSQIIFMVITIFDFKRKITRYALYASLVVFSIMLYGVTYGRLASRVEPREVKIERLPEAFSGYKVVQLSDLHIGNFGDDSFVIKNMVEKVNALQPDVILFTGDLVNLRSDELLPFMDILSKLKAKDGIFSVLGNHDYGDYVHWATREERDANIENLCTLQKQMGWNLLNNQNHTIRRGQDSIVIIGVENWGLPPFPKHGDLNKALIGLDENSFKILLSHNPTHWDAEVVKHTDIDLMLSGHTHAMQVKISAFGKQYSLSSLMYIQWSGLYKKGEQYLYVNDGFGYAGLPMRIGTRPEITAITLKK